jgi:putative SOS response-associated peptidase YedK
MCGRFTLSAQPALIAEAFGLSEVPPLAPRYNIAPTQRAAVIRQPSGGGAPRLEELRWGLVPAWADDPSIGNRLINARSETVAEKPSFRSAFRHRRCLVPADGFYEWAKTSGGRQPWHFHRPDHGPFGLAGLWERWQAPGSEPLETFTILTTAANPVVARVHERMPVILPPEAYEEWLDPELDQPAHLARWLAPAPEELLVATAVSQRVNSSSVDDPDCLAPVGDSGVGGAG